MKFIKKLLIIIVFILLIPLVAALFLPKTYKVVREISIQKPKAAVYDYLKYLKNQDQYSKWATMDTNMKKTYFGEDGTVGFVSAWDSDNEDVGKGEQEITQLVEGARIDYELRFIEPFESKDFTYIETKEQSDSTTLVKWGFDGSMKYPMNLMMLFYDFEDLIGRDLETGLINLKGILETE